MHGFYYAHLAGQGPLEALSPLGNTFKQCQYSYNPPDTFDDPCTNTFNLTAQSSGGSGDFSYLWEMTNAVGDPAFYSNIGIVGSNTGQSVVLESQAGSALNTCTDFVSYVKCTITDNVTAEVSSVITQITARHCNFA